MRPRRLTALLERPATATPATSARRLGQLLWILTAVILIALAFFDDDETPAAVAVPAAALTGTLAAALLRWHSPRAFGVHAALAATTAVVLLLALSTQDVQLSSAYAGGLLLLAVVIVGACSWLGTVLHLLPAVVVLVARQVLSGSPEWSATGVELAVVVVTTVYAGQLVRAAAAGEVDQLTGLLNRRGGVRALDGAAASVRAGALISVAVVDVDHFKQVNDTQGHDAGDQLLRTIAQVLRRVLDADVAGSVRPVVARWGGDEFVVAAGCDPQRLASVLEGAQGQLRGVRYSVGAARLDAGHGLTGALVEADRALYAAKRANRSTAAGAARGSERSGVEDPAALQVHRGPGNGLTGHR